MNMTEKGIGWGVTTHITGYTGGTISNIPIGCTVAIESSGNVTQAKFSGTFSSMVALENQTLVGSTLPMQSLIRDTFYPTKTGGGIYQALLEEEKEAA